MLNNGDNGQLSFIDLISIISFIVGLENLELNVTQEDMDRQTADIDKVVNDRIEYALSQIHRHLEEQDIKIDRLLEVKNGNYRNIHKAKDAHD